MNILRRSVVIPLVGLAMGLSCHAAHSLIENFSGPAISPWLQADPVYQFNGIAQNVGGARRYVRTVDTDYLAADFTMTLTYTVPTTGFGEPIAFLGVGSGTPTSWFYDEPLTSAYLRHCPNDFPGGGLGGMLSVSLNRGSSVDESRVLGYPGGGTHRARITKVGDVLTMAVDINSSTGVFVPDYTQTLSVSHDLFFLNASNSRLFFGTMSSTTTFDDLVITVPEPTTTAIWVLGFGCWGLRRRTSARTPSVSVV